MADLSSIDKYFDRIVRGLPNDELDQIERAPASEGPSNPNAVLNAFGTSMPQKESETVISAETPRPIEYPTAYKPKVPQSEIIRDNVNFALEGRQRDAKDLAANMQDVSREYAGEKAQMKEALAAIQNSGRAQYQPNADIEDRLKKARTEHDNIEDVPERDLLSEAILSFGPAILGAFTGESGQLAQLPATKEARATFESRRKESIDRVKSKREAAEKRYNELVKLKQSDREAFDKSQQREMERLKSVLTGTGDLAKMSLGEMQKYEDKINNLNKEISEGIQKNSTEIAKMERSDELEKNKDQRAKIMASIAQQKVNQPTQGERDAAARYGRAMNASQNLQALGADTAQYPALKDPYYGMKSEAFKRGGPVNHLIQNSVKDPGVRASITAETEWGQNFLRDETGAAIKDEELPQELNKVFPRYGDTPEVIKQKTAIRKQYENGLIVQMGRAHAPKIESPAPVPKQQLTIEQKREAAKKLGYK